LGGFEEGFGEVVEGEGVGFGSGVLDEYAASVEAGDAGEPEVVSEVGVIAVAEERLGVLGEGGGWQVADVGDLVVSADGGDDGLDLGSWKAAMRSLARSSWRALRFLVVGYSTGSRLKWSRRRWSPNSWMWGQTAGAAKEGERIATLSPGLSLGRASMVGGLREFGMGWALPLVIA
jgi:hypothetical protein